jgi:hypothetical protein
VQKRHDDHPIFVNSIQQTILEYEQLAKRRVADLWNHPAAAGEAPQAVRHLSLLQNTSRAGWRIPGDIRQDLVKCQAGGFGPDYLP